MTLSQAKIVATVPVVDLERAKEFYTQKLGLRITNTKAPATVLAESGDGTRIMLYQREQGTQADHTAAVWQVQDLEKAVNELTRKGVVFEQYDTPDLKTDEHGIAALGGERVAWFKDTEGNILALTAA